LRML